jgi:predicted Zn-dependent protease
VARSSMLLVIGAAASFACATNPATGERQLVLVSEGKAKALGEESAAQITQSVGVVDDARLSQYVSGIGNALAAKSERPDAGWKFQVLDDPSVNAFALPGGFIFVTRGILAHLGSEAQLAMVVGHEIGHVTGKHSVDQMSKATVAQLGLGLGAAVSDTFRQYGTAVAGAGMKVLFLKYGREDEYQADELGVRYASRGGYAPAELPKVFEVLDRVGKKGGSSLPEWLSTHPSPGNRIEEIRGHIAKVTATGSNVGEVEYLRRIDGIVYGKDPRQGYFKGTRFVHPQLGFEMTFPAGWKTSNTAEAVVAANEAGDAMLQLAVSDAASAEAALQAFLGKKGVTAGTRGAGGASSTFEVTTDDGVLGGLVSFFEHGGKTYGLLGVTKQANLQAQIPAFEAARASFGPLKDPALAKVEPQRLEIVEVPRPMTLAELHESHGATVPLDELSLLNGLQPQTKLPTGKLVKMVRGRAP